MSDCQKKRCDEEIEELLCEIVTSSEKYLSTPDGDDSKELSKAACEFRDVVVRHQFPAGDEKLKSLTGTAVISFAQQVVFTEISHRVVDGHIPVSLKYVIS